MTNEELKYSEEQELLDALSASLLEEQQLEDRYHKEMERAIAEVFEDYFYDSVNDYNHPQTYQVDDNGKSFPVCSCCHAMVMPNRGQGTACDSCQYEDYMQCVADYGD